MRTKNKLNDGCCKVENIILPHPLAGVAAFFAFAFAGVFLPFLGGETDTSSTGSGADLLLPLVALAAGAAAADAFFAGVFALAVFALAAFAAPPPLVERLDFTGEEGAEEELSEEEEAWVDLSVLRKK